MPEHEAEACPDGFIQYALHAAPEPEPSRASRESARYASHADVESEWHNAKKQATEVTCLKFW